MLGQQCLTSAGSVAAEGKPANGEKDIETQTKKISKT